MTDSEKPNLSMDFLGESRQRVDVRLPTQVLNGIHKVLARKREQVRVRNLQEPTMTWVLEYLISKEIEADDQLERSKDKSRLS